MVTNQFVIVSLQQSIVEYIEATLKNNNNNKSVTVIFEE